jgi:hypothetical protein
MLDSIVYGNPTRDILPYLEATSFLDKHLESLKNFTPPKNTSKATREELNNLVDLTNELDNDPTRLQKYKNYDHELEKIFVDIALRFGFDEKLIEMIDSLFDDLNPFIAKLKVHFNRARPYQLAFAYKLRLFPFPSRTAANPSYPSGHALQSKVICYVLGNHIPENYDYFENLGNDICYSRQYMGLHYPSDVDFAILCFEQIVRDKEFKAKYGL